MRALAAPDFSEPIDDVVDRLRRIDFVCVRVARSNGSTRGNLAEDQRAFLSRLAVVRHSDRSLVPESVERGRIDDPTGEVGAVSREPLDHESVVGDLRMRGDEAERLACSKPKRG